MNFKEVNLDMRPDLADARKSGMAQLLLHLASTEGERLLITKKDFQLYFCARPDDIKTVFTLGHRNHRQPLNDMLGNGLFSISTSPAHREIRSAVQALYSSAKLREMAELIEADLPACIDTLFAGKERLDTHALFDSAKKCCIRMNAIIMFGPDVPLAVTQAIEIIHENMNAGLFSGAGVDAVLNNPTFNSAKQTIGEHIVQLIASWQPQSGVYQPLLIELAQTLEADHLQHADLQGEVLSLLGSGLETAGATIFWALYELSRSSMQQQIYTWVEASASPPSEFSLRRDTPIAQAILETLRLYPSGWAMFRQANEALELEPGVSVPAGARICVSPYVTQRLEHLWPDAEAFHPERFADPAQAAQSYSQFHFFPFAGGVHRCIGERLALMEIGLAVSQFLKCFEIGCDNSPRLRTLNKLCLVPDGDANFTLLARKAT